ncbi:hypothetical protein Cni_G03865 [Canna indica]|uniref:RING-type domain-containing protein n=1 Tax=Canna indica TaxID=4628 RepID=A0AAQ3JTE7_9LILI|nr:hypothetical protein Cni_G03865 [Canna indica]
MAIQAQCPSAILLPNRGEETIGAGLAQGQSSFLDPSTVMFFAGGGSLNPRDRGRDEAAAALPTAIRSTPAQDANYNVSSLFSQPSRPLPTLISLAQLQSKSNSPLVSTGLRLSFGTAHQQQYHNLNPFHPADLFDELDLAPHFKQFQEDIDGYLQAQEQVLKRTLAVKWQSHYRTLITTGAAAARQRIKAKDAELKQAAQQYAELEERLAQLRAETVAWQAKAVAAQNQAAALQAQLQQAEEVAAVAREREGDSDDPSVMEGMAAASGSCRACYRRDAPVAVVVLPCRHLCVCADCAAAGAIASCPVCCCISTGSINVAYC